MPFGCSSKLECFLESTEPDPELQQSSPARVMHPASPTTGSERLDLLDALRGFALMGVLLVNLRSLSLYEFLPETGRAALPSAEWDQMVAIAIAALVEGKSITLFYPNGETLRMPIQRSGSGFRYGEGNVGIAGKGQTTITLQIAGQPARQCVTPR